MSNPLFDLIVVTLLPLVPTILLYLIFQKENLAEITTEKLGLGGWGPIALKAGGPVAMYLVLFVSSRFYYSDFREEQLNIAKATLHQVLSKHNLQISDLDRAATYYKLLEDAMAVSGIQVDRVTTALKSVSEQIALKEKLIGQYCYFFRPYHVGPEKETGQTKWFAGSVSILDVRDDVAPQLFGRINSLEMEFKSRRLHADEDGLFYDWVTHSVYYDPGKVHFGVAQLRFTEWSDDRGQVVRLTGNFTDFQSPASHLQLIRKDDKYYGQRCEDIAERVSLTVGTADDLQQLVEGSP